MRVLPLRVALWPMSFVLLACGAACSSGVDDAAVVTVEPATGGSSGAGGAVHAGGAAGAGGASTVGAGGAGVGAGGATAGSGGHAAGAIGGGGAPVGGGGSPAGGGGTPAGEGGAQGPGAGGKPAGAGGMTVGAGGMNVGAGGMPIGAGGMSPGTGGKAGSASGGSPSAGAGGMPGNGCDTLQFPSVELVTVPDAALTAEYEKLGVTGCDAPTCFLDVTDLQSPDGTKHDIHVNVSPNFQLYELVGTDVDPNGTGDVDPAHAYSTHVLLSVDLMVHLQKLREAYGGPVTITSGFRSPAHQHSICQSICGADQCPVSGGPVTCAKNSRHMWGAAADMDLKYESAANAAGFAFVYHENGGTGPHLHVDMQSCQ